MKRLTLTGLLLFAALLLSAQPLQLAHVFSDHAVLQRETAAPFWGWGEPGKTVTVTASWTQEAVKAKVAADGSWRVTLPTGAAGGPYTLTVKSGKESLTVSDVMLGEVLVCSGQSNMEMPMRGFGFQQIDGFRKLGISYMEMRGVDGNNLIYHSDEKVREIKKRLDDAGIRLSACGSPLGKIDISDPFPPHLESLKRAIGVAHRMGTDNIRMFSFYLPAEERAACRSAVFDRIGQMVRCAEENGAVLLHENEKGIYGWIPSTGTISGRSSISRILCRPARIPWKLSACSAPLSLTSM